MAGELDLSRLRERLEGEVLSPADAGYEDARRVWNGVIDRRPAAIARCRGSADVAAAIAFAREHDLAIAVRGGGHNVAGTASVDDGLVIDLSPMRGVDVDAGALTVRVQGGATLGDLDAATQAHGLAVPVGVVSETGVAGLTLSGGIGWLRRKHGMSCDNLNAAEVVTANGEVLTASAEEHPDLFWALRGGGGNFGVVTSFEFGCHPTGPEVALCFVLYPGDRAPEILGGCADHVAQGPEDVAPLAFLGRVPREESYPEASHGKPFVAVAAVHPARPDEGERILRPLRELGDPIVDLSDQMPWVDVQKLLDEEYPSGRRYYWKSVNLTGLSEEAIRQLMASADAMPSDLSTIDIWFQGGAMGRVAPEATAFGDRSSPILIGVEANWEGPENDEANIAWARGCVDDLDGFSSGGTYLNFPGFLEDRERLLRAAYGANYDRLVEVKTRYDPENVFHVNQNIPPSRS